MKRFIVMGLATALVLLTACEGDNPGGEGGTLPVVTGLTVDWAQSDGVDINLDWDAVSDVDGYNVYFRATSSGTWTEVGDVTTTTYTHTASSAGYYAVEAYKGSDTSEALSSEVSTMPNIITTEYEIYDNYAPADWHSGFIFGLTAGETGLAGSSAFVQDIYAYDPWTDPGRAALYSGDYGPFGDGNETWMIGLGDPGCDNAGAAPDVSAGWWDNGEVWEGDVIFCELYDGYFAKMYINYLEGPVGGSSNGTGIAFTYEIQPQAGIRLFTTNQ